MIYVVQARDTHFVKIGCTDLRLRERIASLQTGCPHELVLLLAFPGGMDEEAAAHERFAHLSERGEWFRLEPEVVGWIADRWAFRVANDVGEVRIAFSPDTLMATVLPPVVEPITIAPPSTATLGGMILAHLIEDDRSLAPVEIAAALGLDRNAVCSVLSRLRTRGHVHQVDGRYQAAREERNGQG